MEVYAAILSEFPWTVVSLLSRLIGQCAVPFLFKPSLDAESVSDLSLGMLPVAYMASLSIGHTMHRTTVFDPLLHLLFSGLRPQRTVPCREFFFRVAPRSPAERFLSCPRKRILPPASTNHFFPPEIDLLPLAVATILKIGTPRTVGRPRPFRPCTPCAGILPFPYTHFFPTPTCQTPHSSGPFPFFLFFGFS